jgi:acetyltransferase-like isoleucine patch superfamily enzyme
MNALIKRILKVLIKIIPVYQIRASMLRWCGYTVGRDVYIGEDLLIIDEPNDRGMVNIGDRVAISPRVTLVISSRPNFSRIAPYVPIQHDAIIIEADSWLGTGTVVLPGTRIGEGAVIAANSVVNRDVEPYTIVGGSPVRHIKNVEVPWREEAKNLAR